jgi:hypothetical protein
MHSTCRAGTFLSLTLSMAAKKITVTFNPMASDGYSYAARRLRVDKVAAGRPGEGFAVGGAKKERGAYAIAAAVMSADVTWS